MLFSLKNNGKVEHPQAMLVNTKLLFQTFT